MNKSPQQTSRNKNHGHLLLLHGLKGDEELVREGLTSHLELVQLTEHASVQLRRFGVVVVAALEHEVEDELGVMGAVEGLVERGDEVEGVEGAIEVVLDEVK
ncbi:Os02g0323700 [Oryza sativa Japonica Group]|uniref:Uncharacterized protein n=3 Tax=Oryza TaxID=4527 RepID=B9F5D2_ORYSJ|nr:hypothetical protein OsJ_06488 [Oryza sativa Japonica Group]BAD15954.1 hypothetical protein [Oryza sativa Japonica Group]BAS78394.1 Os02g0323700 [Oryza sativa Japonica Group]